MPFVVRCECGRRIKAEDRYAGRRAPCPACRRIIHFPTLDRVESPAGPAAVPRPKPPSPTPRARPAPPPPPARAPEALDFEPLFDLGGDDLDVPAPAPIARPRLRPKAVEPPPEPEPKAKTRRKKKKKPSQGSLRLSPRLAAFGLLLGLGGWALSVVLGRGLAGAADGGHRARCAANLKRIGQAVEKYVEQNGHLPGPLTDAAGRPLLSWRVAILPQLGEQTLYNQFLLDQPWNHDHNLALFAQMPEVFDCPAHVDSLGKTTYRGYSADHTLFQPGRAIRFKDVEDGPSGTILLVDSEQSVGWTAHDELPVPAPLQAPVPRGNHAEGFHALFADGTVKFLKSRINPMAYNALLTFDGGEAIAFD